MLDPAGNLVNVAAPKGVKCICHSTSVELFLLLIIQFPVDEKLTA